MAMKRNKKICWRWRGDVSGYKTDFYLGETEDRLTIRYICCPIVTINPRKTEIEFYFPKKDVKK